MEWIKRIIFRYFIFPTYHVIFLEALRSSQSKKEMSCPHNLISHRLEFNPRDSIPQLNEKYATSLRKDLNKHLYFSLRLQFEQYESEIEIIFVCISGRKNY